MFCVKIPKVITRQTAFANKTTGEPYTEQVVIFEHPDMLVGLETRVLLRDGQEPYEPGTYALKAESFSAAKYGNIDFRVVLGDRIEEAKAEPKGKAPTTRAAA